MDQCMSERTKMQTKLETKYRKNDSHPEPEPKQRPGRTKDSGMHPGNGTNSHEPSSVS